MPNMSACAVVSSILDCILKVSIPIDELDISYTNMIPHMYQHLLSSMRLFESFPVVVAG